MDSKELGMVLKEMYDNAKIGELTTNIHLFGIKFSSEIRNAGVAEVVKESGLGTSYVAEVNKGINLAKYVKVL